jgi:P-type Ca2+ transporter type 2C
MRHPVPLSRIPGPGASERGLSTADADSRLEHYGENTIVEAGRSGWLDVLRDALTDPMVWFLAGTASLFAILGDYTEAAVLSVALVPIIGLDAYLHKRTKASVEGLSKLLAEHVRVMRDGKEIDIPALRIVPGDLLLTPANTRFPADGVIVAGDNLQVDASALTGEAMPVRKSVFTHTLTGEDAILVDDASWAMAGTRLLTGDARVRVVFTGAETLYGQIVRTAQTGNGGRTPLQKAIGRLVAILLVIAVLLCVGLALVRYAQGFGWMDAAISAVTLAVAAIPEEFPVVFSFFLGIGVFRLAKQRALVRRSIVVENIGRVTCICTDKTGTLTEGRLHLQHVITADGRSEDDVLSVAATAARAESGDPLDLLVLAKGSAPVGRWRAVFPFTEDRRREVGVIETPDGIVHIAIKGAPETVLSMCAMTPEARDDWSRKIRALAGDGHKVIACAEMTAASWSGDEPLAGYRFSGLLAFEDPVRPGVKDAVTEAQDSGIRVIMVTGDHPDTARAIAAELGIGGAEPKIIQGDEFSEDASVDLSLYDVVARAMPAQKLDLVKALQAKNHIVAVTGDGVNDVPALKGADIGIAMGERGTQSAKEVAAIVLLDDNFRTIVNAIAEGRQVFANLKLSFAYLLMIHGPLVATAALLPLLGYPLLYLPIHIVWLELIMHPTALMVFQKQAQNTRLGRADQTVGVQFFGMREWAVIGLITVLVTGLIVWSFAYSLGPDQNVGHARSMALATLLSANGAVTLALRGWTTRGAIIAAAGSLGSAVLLIQSPLVSGLIHLNPLHMGDWAIALLGGGALGSLATLFHRARTRSVASRTPAV